jgi:ubiquinone biosynthesis monooxygenase Coq7
MRKLSRIDSLIKGSDEVLRTVTGNTQLAERPSPAETLPQYELSENKRKHVAGLMRINHTGEVCAQALYQGQAFAAKSEKVKTNMEQAAREEIDHLKWCEQRLEELNDHVSYLNPMWYALSFSIGALAGAAGDSWSLGFVKETEDQVCRHLDEHLEKIPLKDQASRAVLLQMREDEAKHAHMAKMEGARELPEGIKKGMSVISKFMTKSTYYV